VLAIYRVPAQIDATMIPNTAPAATKMPTAVFRSPLGN
jgi:hypothetical protein